MRPPVTLMLCLFLTSCEVDGTAILLHICVEEAVARRIDHIRLLAEDEIQHDRALLLELPEMDGEVTCSLRPGRTLDSRHDFTLTVSGLDHNGSELIRRTVATHFEPDLDRDVAIELRASCIGVTCPAEESCDAGRCQETSEGLLELCEAGD